MGLIGFFMGPERDFPYLWGSFCMQMSKVFDMSYQTTAGKKSIWYKTDLSYKIDLLLVCVIPIGCG